MKKLPSGTLYIGYGGIRFFALDELKSLQSLYLEKEDGVNGRWNPAWIVIGVEESLDDPVFADQSESGYPVYTAIHGEGEWGPVCIAPSLIAFLQAIQVINEYSRGRENPISLEKNPLSVQEFQSLKMALNEVLCRDSNTKVDLEFWLDWLLAE
ncbi:hypothetical protein JOE21_003381 [Desmospora profundinema]|uniref:Knr4/Smi1-like domain-containing protein n=2 Tax=Desmospora profundinema TaxID=1571184 RepID=A0ABU1IRE8_9BACL|nr:hypothetical protein [Desmospora profundinema]